MTKAAPDKEDTFLPKDSSLEGDLYSYIAVLTQRASSSLTFRTGAGRIFRDLLLHWPVLDEWEDQALALCKKIADSVYPLTASLYAQAVEIDISISASAIKAPEHIEAMATYLLFDTEKRLQRHFFLSPKESMPSPDVLGAQRGLAVLCRPLNYRYHTIKDDRGLKAHPGLALFESLERLTNALNNLPDFIPPEKVLIDTIKTDIKSLPKTLERYQEATAANLALPLRHLVNSTPDIVAITSLSTLPPPVKALEQRLMSYVTNPALSAELRQRVRQIAQLIRSHYPQSTLSEAAHLETAPLAIPVTQKAIPFVETSPSPHLRLDAIISQGAYLPSFKAPTPMERSLRPTEQISQVIPAASSMQFTATDPRPPNTPAPHELAHIDFLSKGNEPSSSKNAAKRTNIPRALEPHPLVKEAKTSESRPITLSQDPVASPEPAPSKARSSMRLSRPKMPSSSTADAPITSKLNRATSDAKKPYSEERPDLSRQDESRPSTSFSDRKTKLISDFDRSEKAETSPRQMSVPRQSNRFIRQREARQKPLDPNVKTLEKSQRQSPKLSSIEGKLREIMHFPKRRTPKERTPFEGSKNEPLFSFFGTHDLRPKGFYDKLKIAPHKNFPKATLISGDGKLAKKVGLLVAPKAAPIFQTASPLAQHWSFPTPGPFPTPHAPVFLFRK